MNPWESELGSKIWKNSTAFMTFLRGCFRLGWKKHPLRISVVNKKRKQIDNPNPNGKKPTVWGFTCEMCHKDFVISEGQVDHITAAGKLQSKEDIQGFVERLMFVTEDDLRLVCKSCNNALAMAEKQGITFDVAVKQKQIISIIKAKEDKAFLESKGITPSSNAAGRRKQLEDYFNKETK
jgi:hypothetical protein